MTISLLGMTSPVVQSNLKQIITTGFKVNQNFEEFHPQEFKHETNNLRIFSAPILINTQNVTKDSELFINIRMAYVYELIDPRNGRIFYVGKGNGNRADHHTINVKTGKVISNPYKTHVIKQILESGMEPIVNKVIDGISDKLALKLESMLITIYGRKHIDKYGMLTNLCTNATGGVKGTIRSKESCIKQSITISGCGNHMFGNTHSKQARDKIVKNHADFSGTKNGRAKHYMFTSPNGDTQIVSGRIMTFCKENGFDFSTVFSYLKKQTSPTRGTFAGWRVIEIKK